MPRARALESPPALGRVVLIVGDEILAAMHLELLLHRHGWRVLGPAATVADALRLLQDEAPDVALLDVNLSGEPVTPVAEEVRARGVPVTALAGAPIVGKPTDEQHLFAVLAQAVAL